MLRRMSFVIQIAFFYIILITTAYAACSDNIQSIEEEFVSSDVIFRGALKESERSNNIFEVKEFYKTSDQSYVLKKDITVKTSGFDRGKFSESINLEWIIFGNLRPDDDAVYLTNCSKSQLVPQDYISTLKKKNEDSFDLEFIGELSRSKHSEDISVLSFNINELIHGEELEEIKKVEVESFRCGQLLEIGKNYVVRAQSKVAEEKDGIKIHKYHMHCTARSPVMIDLIERLISLKTNSHPYN